MRPLVQELRGLCGCGPALLRPQPGEGRLPALLGAGLPLKSGEEWEDCL